MFDPSLNIRIVTFGSVRVKMKVCDCQSPISFTLHEKIWVQIYKTLKSHLAFQVF